MIYLQIEPFNGEATDWPSIFWVNYVQTNPCGSVTFLGRPCLSTSVHTYLGGTNFTMVPVPTEAVPLLLKIAEISTARDGGDHPRNRDSGRKMGDGKSPTRCVSHL